MERKEKRLTITLYEDDVTELKMEALRQGTTLKGLIEKVLNGYMKDRFIPPTPERYYDTKDIAIFTGLKPNTILKHYARGNLKGIKHRNEIFSTVDNVKEFLEYLKNNGRK